MSFLSKLFGGGSGGEAKAPTAAAVEYKGFRIIPDPAPEGGQFRVCALIELETEGQTRSHRLIRADLVNGREAAEETSLFKAKQLIDQQGEALFR